MCGRYHIGLEGEDPRVREIVGEINRRGMSVRTGEIAPGMEAAALCWENGVRATSVRWGARSRTGVVINARAETAREKMMFRQSTRSRRLLLPTDGFYEWKRLPGGARGTKYFVRAADGGLLCMGALGVPTAEGVRLVVLTRPADGQVAPLHDRMPLFIGEELRESWLRGDEAAWDAALAAEPPRLLLEAVEPEQLTLF